MPERRERNGQPGAASAAGPAAAAGGPGDDDGYDGPATLAVAGTRLDVHVRLRGHFEPIDGRYHWYGRIARHDGLAAAVRSGRATGTLATPAGSAPCDICDPDPWQRFRVTGISTPPFPTALSGSLPESGAAATATGAATATAAEPAAASPAAARLPSHVRIAIIGAGFGGLGAGIRLRETGRDDFAILERASSVGGTWRDNTYPGCACDVPSHLYSFSFALNPEWSRSFSRQPEIWNYLEEITDRYRVREHIHFGTEVAGARWDAAQARWQIRTSRGDLTAGVLISAAGP
ncbi:MAG: DUF4873 domain-containing protein, partial [Actinobacteria bacterium]|nr:DUF4873 domain-containing protein [Actinomycetota bacterium]